MPRTGKMRGLTQDWWFDGRRDVIASTEAALVHLESLNRQMNGDWLHALASYNAGSGTLRHAIRKNRQRGKSTAYWALDLPAETDAYVPRLLALSAIIADPLRYDVELPDLPDRPQFMVMDIRSQLDLGVAAKLANVPIKELAELNAGLNRLATPPAGPHRLLIPYAHTTRFEAGLAKLPAEARLQRDRYTVKSGDSLSVIASRHGITIAALKSANGLRSNRIRVGQDLLVPRYASALALAPIQTTLPRSRVRYKVRSGDSLYEIAQKFRVSVGQLRRWNRLSGSLLRPGQQLTLFVDPARQTL
jgi:membrane-bound lytic murein transglycosylase D